MCCNGKEKGKHFNCHWLMFRNHASSAYQRLLKKKTCFALYGACHKASNTLKCLSLSSELKKKAALPCLKSVYITDDFAFEVPDRWLPARTDLTHPNPCCSKRWEGCLVGEKCWWSRTRAPLGSRNPFHTLYFDEPLLALLPVYKKAVFLNSYV